ncbi:hypothetical protein LIA77_11515 [Sarocladium implicatum]|nr:hypothetical protein LIA77_11515 [Sarocladium implicatum]
MRFSNLLPAAAGFAGLASATLGKIPCVSDLVKGTDKVVKPVFDLAHHWEDDILFQGELCAATETSAAIDLDLRLIQAAVDGQVGIDVSAKFLQAPALRLSLAGVKAFVQLDLSASAAVYESVELFITPELSVDLLSILNLDLKALIALDLLVGVSAGVDVSAGVYVSFNEDAYIDIDLLKKDVIDVNLANPSIEALPIAIGAEVDLSVAVELELGLRLRTYIALEADVEIIGIDLLEAGAEVAIYVNLFDYKTTLIDGSGSCAVSCSKDIALTLGLAVKLDVSILDLIDVSLTPNVFLTLATIGDAEICLPDRGTFPDGSHIGGGDKETGSPSGLPSVGLPSAGLPSAGLPSGPIPTPDGSEIVDGGDKEIGLPSGLPSAGLPSAGLPSAGLPSAGLPSGPIPTPDGSEIVDGGNTGSDSDKPDAGSDSGSDGSDSGSDSGSDDSETGSGSGSGSGSATITAAPSVHTPVHGGNGTLSTSTEQVTATYTITKCEIDVVNCPANKKTVIVHSTVYYCPATKTKVPHLPEITKTSTMTPCPTPTTVTITDSPAKPTATPETPEHEKPKKPEGEKPKQPEGEKPKQPEQPEHEKPEQPEEEKPQQPEHEKPEQPEQPEEEKPEQPEHEQPEAPVCPGSPECPEETMVHAPPPSAAIPTPPANTPTEDATAGAGSMKVGMASVFLGAAIAVML